MSKELLLAKVKQYPLAVVSIGITLILILIIYTRSGRLPALETELEQLDTTWTVIQNNDLRAVDMQMHLDTINAANEEIDTRLMDPENKAINYQYIFQLEPKCGVRLDNLQQNDPIVNNKGDYYTTINFDISASGTYRQILNFVYELQNGRYLTRIDGFNFNAVGELEPNLVQIDIKMAVLGLK